LQKTLHNLVKAFVGESQAANRYLFYAKVARKEGYEQIAEVFEITAENEREHASTLFKLINEIRRRTNNAPDEVKVEVGAPIVLGSTVENLKAAIIGENYEHTKMYPEFADVAESEGLIEVANRLRAIARAEEHHEQRFRKILKELEAGSIFRKKKKIWWVCMECGYVHYGEEPPEECPSCGHSRAYFKPLCEEY